MEACQVAIREHLPVSPGSPAATASAVCLGLQALVDDASETSLRHKFASVGNSRRLQAATLHLSEGLDVVFIFLAAVLVFFMQAGFAMVRAQVRLPKQCILTKPSLIRLSYTMRTSQLDSKLVHLHRLTNTPRVPVSISLPDVQLTWAITCSQMLDLQHVHLVSFRKRVPLHVLCCVCSWKLDQCAARMP